MISVMNDFEIDRNHTSAHDLSFFGMESPKKEEERMDLIGPEIPQPIGLPPVESPDLEESRARVSSAVNGQQLERSSPTVPESELELDAELDDEDDVDMNGFTTGDMVWGKVKSHPWWPGHIFNESFASPDVVGTKRDGYVLVAFFGDSSYGWFNPAELIPFEENFLEKSRQTSMKSFVRAVEESVDETSRRAGLGLACRCLNPYNFRPTGVPNYYAVDVIGYERNGIYSRRQINREREAFDAKRAVDFLRQLAVKPRWSDRKDADWHRNVAQAFAVRRIRFEDFDETYAQAFGQKAVRPALNEMGVPEQAENFAPRVAPLSGPLVFAEPLGERRRHRSAARASSSSSAAAAAVASSSSAPRDRSTSKKNKYVLKRREEHPAASSSLSPPPPLPNAFFLIGDSSSSASASASSDYVLQKREPDSPQPQTPPIPTSVEEDDINADDKIAVAPDAGVIVKKEKKAVDKREVAPDAGVVKKEKKVKKRSLEDVGGGDDEDNKKNKKKKKKKSGKDKEKHGDGPGQDLPSAPKKAPSSGAASQGLPVASPPAMGGDLCLSDQLDLPSIVADLKSLALDPFYGIERNVPSVIRHMLLGFRSVVYSKSLVVPSASESDSQGPEVQAGKPAVAAPRAASPPLSIKEAKEQQQQKQRDQGSSAAKPVKLLKRSDDPTKAGRKRPLSDRQEEMTAKKKKKVSQLKLLAGEKKAALNPKTSTSEGAKANNAGTSTAGSANAAEVPGASAEEPVRKPERLEPLLPAPPRRESPTFLIMWFPPRSTLPSVSNLKARFARFGPLAIDGTRVFWKSHSCRVQFKYKSDALRALSYVKSNDIFGQVPVEYSLKEVDAPAAEPAAEASKRADGGQFRPGKGSLLRQTQGRLKSILKKPGDEAGKESQRVKFMLSGEESPPSASGNGVRFTEPPPPPPLPEKSTSFQLPPATQPRQTLPQSQPPPLLAPPPITRSYEPQRMEMLPPPPPASRMVENRPLPAVQFSERLRPQLLQDQRYGGGGFEMEGKSRGDVKVGNADISHQMLSLLLQCNDIIAGLRALPDFVPYRPL